MSIPPKQQPAQDFLIYGLDHVQLAMPAGQEDVARAFYSEMLGLKEVAKPQNLANRGGAWFENGSLKLHLGVEPDFRPARKAHPALLVQNLKSLVAGLETADIPIVRDEPLEGYERVHVADPFGNRIELMEPAATDFVPHEFRVDDRLRVRTPVDAEELFRLTDANRTYLRQWLPWLDRTTCVDDTCRVIESAARQIAARQGYQAVVCLDEKIVGTIGFHTIDWQNRSTSIGYWLAEGQQGRGLMTSACRVVIRHAFTVWNVNRIVIRCATGNIRSQAVADRLGFQREGIHRQAEWLYDHYEDQYNYSLLRTDWERIAT